jgi:hypothetical protein
MANLKNIFIIFVEFFFELKMINVYLRNKMPEIIKLLMQYKVTSAFAFGSVCTDKFNEQSDIDMLVNLDDNLEPLERGELFWQLWDDLEKTLNRKVDLLSEKSLTNPYFIEELNEKKVSLYEKRS